MNSKKKSQKVIKNESGDLIKYVKYNYGYA